MPQKEGSTSPNPRGWIFKHYTARLGNLHHSKMHSQESAIRLPNTSIDATPATSGGMK
jgi:hypothetical protein